MTYDMPRSTADVTYRPSLFSSASKTTVKNPNVNCKIMEDQSQEVDEKAPVKLGTEAKNSIRQTFEALLESNGKDTVEGEVAKSKLQLLCANISQDFGIGYSSDDLDNFMADKKSLSCGEFVDYLEDELLPKGNNTDLQKEHKVFWTIVSQTFYKRQEHLLTEDQAYKQWLLFNILDIDETSRVHKEELGLILQRVCHGIGKVWNPVPLNECTELEELTFWQYLECLEKHYLVDCDKSVYLEALEEVVDYVVNDVLIQGFITKKGHMIKSTKTRWFVLKPGHLLYFTNRSCTDKKGEIAINSNTKVAGVPDNKKYRFTITCGETKTHYDLEVRDQRAKQEWLVALQKAIASSGGQSVQRKERLQRRLDRNERKLAKLEEERRKREQENLVQAQQKELELLRQKYSDAEAQALIEAENLQDEIRRREELEKLHLELQGLLLAEKEAREAEAKARALQEELLLNEKKRLEEMERMKAEKESLLQDELRKRESLEERQKLQDKLLEEERQRLEELERERQAAEQAMKEANDKLLAAEEASRKAAEDAKKKAREIKTCTGLARPVGPHVPSFITHRGIGAFCENDFSKLQKVKKAPPTVKPKPKRNVVNSESGNDTEPTDDIGDENELNEEHNHEDSQDVEGQNGDIERTEKDQENHEQEIVANDNVVCEQNNVCASQDENKNEEESIERDKTDGEENPDENKTSGEENPEENKTSGEENIEENKTSGEENIEKNKTIGEENIEENKTSREENIEEIKTSGEENIGGIKTSGDQIEPNASTTEETQNDEFANCHKEEEKMEDSNKDTTQTTSEEVEVKLECPELKTEETNNEDTDEISVEKPSDKTLADENASESTTLG